jgi:hypothetical protein
VKKVPAKCTKRSPHKISQNGAPAKSYSTQNTDQIYRPASASNLLIPAKLPVLKRYATLLEMNMNDLVMEESNRARVNNSQRLDQCINVARRDPARREEEQEADTP